MIRVLVADDHPIAVEGFKRIIGAEADLAVVGSVARTGRIIPFLQAHPVDVLTLDISMNNGNFLDCIDQVSREFPRVRILVVSLHKEKAYAMRCLRAGAAGYLEKVAAAGNLVAAIRQVNAGHRYVSPDFAQQLIDEFLHKSGDYRPHEKLTKREFEVFELLARGLRPSEIARELSLSPKTVSTHRKHILEKLGVDSNSGIVQYALSLDLFGNKP